MAFDLSILNEEEKDRVLNIASEISMAAMSLRWSRTGPFPSMQGRMCK